VDLLAGLLTVAGAPLLRLIRASLRLRVANRAVARAYAVPGRAVGIGAFWHRHLIPVAAFCCRLDAVAMISRSRDGELIARALARTPLGVVRGSSSRGGREALEELVEAVRAGRSGALACDGPRGPARRVKPGVVVAAQRTGVPIVPISCAARHRTVLRSWDRTLVPWPGTRVVVAFGDPIRVPPDADDARRESIRADLERLLIRMEQACEAAARRKP
jgi:lysophospholipid acyltransferase (LPLAT)-like uncharacterized protein